MHYEMISMMRNAKKYISKCMNKAMMLVSVFILSTLFTQVAMAIETPRHTVTKTDGYIELRTYAPKIIAETVVTASYENAGNKGFRILADYIFGNNTVQSKTNPNQASQSQAAHSEKIAMTAHVIRSPNNASSKIAMTSPVVQDKVASSEDEQQWRIQFVMPSKYNMDTLPKPNSDKVTIKQTPETRYAVIRFSGFTGTSKVTKKTTQLKSWMQANGITPKGEPALARYNPPWTPPFMRRNEVMIAY